MPAHLLMSCPRLPVAPGQGLPFTWVQYCQLVQRSGLPLPSHDWLAAIGGLAYVAAIASFRWRG
jgi:hypothetical protein